MAAGILDIIIEVGLMLRLAFGRPWVQTEGMLGSLMNLLSLDLAVPDHTMFSRRSVGLGGATALRKASARGNRQQRREGFREWLHEKRGGTPHWSWRKLHLAVDPNSDESLAGELTTTDEGDASLVGPLLDQVDSPLASMPADGAYDGELVYRSIAGHIPNATVTIPPRSTAVMCRVGHRPHSARPPHPADRGVWSPGMAARRRLRPPVSRGGRNAALQGTDRPPRANSADTEDRGRLQVINIMTGLGMPVSRRIAWPAWERVKSAPFLIFAPTSFSVKSNRVGIRHIVQYPVIMHHMLMTGETFR
jgi:hypothetical protein